MNQYICINCSELFEAKKFREKCCKCVSSENLKKSSLKRIDITDKRFGKLLVLSYSHTHNNEAYWLCETNGGKKIIRRGKVLKRIIKPIQMRYKQSSTYRTWSGMKYRCYNKNYSGFKNYGGKGIEVCESWINSYENFLRDMGEKPFGKSLDRLNNDHNYCKENCRWSTNKEQQRNRLYCRRIKAFGKVKILVEWAEQYGIRADAISWRLKNGWKPEEAIATKIGGRKK